MLIIIFQTRRNELTVAGGAWLRWGRVRWTRHWAPAGAGRAVAASWHFFWSRWGRGGRGDVPNVVGGGRSICSGRLIVGDLADDGLTLEHDLEWNEGNHA
jgi:hypothetical protein